MYCPTCKQDTPTTASGLTQGGLILFIVLLLFCLPLCWIPFVMDTFKKRICNQCGRPLN